MIYNHPIGKDYKWYILPIGGLYGTYHPLREPGNSLDFRSPGQQVIRIIRVRRPLRFDLEESGGCGRLHHDMYHGTPLKLNG